MPWSTSQRRATLPKDWHRRRAVAARNANGQCQWLTNGQRCTRAGTDCDHITPGAGDHPANLQWLCKAHHAAKSSAEGVAARPSRKRTTQRHPGLL